MQSCRVPSRSFSQAKADALSKYRVEGSPRLEDIDELGLIIDAAVNERPVQEFLTRHPELLTAVLTGTHARFALPELELGNQLRADFFIADVNSLGLRWIADLLAGLRDDLKARRFEPLPVREAMIPKTGGKLRRLGIPTARDRVVQAALKLVLEPIFEADFRPCSHGFRPGRRAQDALAEIRHLTSVRYEWVLEGDITACFDEIDHTALIDRVRRRIGDKRVLGLVKAFLKAGVLSEDDIFRDTDTGTPQGGILSPLLANIALSVLDDHFVETWQSEMATVWQRKKRRNHW